MVEVSFTFSSKWVGWNSSHVLSEWQLNFPIQNPECVSILWFLPVLSFKVRVKLGDLFSSFLILIQTHQNVYIQITAVPFIVFSLRRLKIYWNAVATAQTRKGFALPLFWNCFQHILLKILPANKSLSFEGWIWYLKITKRSLEPSLTHEVWVIRLTLKQSVTPCPVDVRRLPGRALPVSEAHLSRHPQWEHLCHQYLAFFPLLNRNKDTGFEN